MKFNIITLLVSITFLSLLDVLFDYAGLPKSSIFASIWILFVLAFLFSFFRLLTDFKFESKYFKYVFVAFFLYGLITVLRGWSFDRPDLTSFLRVPHVFWPFLMPLFIFIDKKFFTISFLMECFYYLGLVFLLVVLVFPHLLVFRPTSEPIIFALAFTSGFLLLNAIYLSKTKINLSFLILIVSILCTIYLARRTSAFLFILILMSSYLLSLFSKFKPFIFKIFPLLVVVATVIFFSFADFSKLLTSNLNERLDEDTRSDVIEYFMKGMKKDMVFGKGMNGKYFFPTGGGEEREDGMVWEEADDRDIIENGYLQLMLSGGYIHLILFLLVAVPAAYKGILKSSNQFTRSCGVLVFIWLLYMFAYGEPRLSIGYMLIWIAIAVCYKPSLRNKTDFDITLGLNSAKSQLRYGYSQE